MTVKSHIWIFANRAVGEYETSDWDISTILKRKRYYFRTTEKNRYRVEKGDNIIFREYGTGFWGTAEVSGNWEDDPKGEKKYDFPAGWFPISKIKKFNATLPYEVIRPELSNQNHRLRIASANVEDLNAISLGVKIYKNLGYGAPDGEFLLLESGIEEAVKSNLHKLGLRLADESIQQQCSLDVGVGRADLICLNENDDYVVVELKAFHTSDVIIGQILRYMGYVRKTWAEKEGKNVRGLVLAPSFDEHLHLAASEAGIKMVRVRLG